MSTIHAPPSPGGPVPLGYGRRPRSPLAAVAWYGLALVVVGVGALCGAAAGHAAAPVRYRSEGLIDVRMVAGAGVTNGDVAMPMAAGSPDAARDMQRLQVTTISNAGFLQSTLSDPASGLPESRRTDAAAADLAARIRVEPVPGSLLIRVSCTDADPAVATQAATAVIVRHVARVQMTELEWTGLVDVAAAPTMPTRPIFPTGAVAAGAAAGFIAGLWPAALIRRRVRRVA